MIVHANRAASGSIVDPAMKLARLARLLGRARTSRAAKGVISKEECDELNAALDELGTNSGAPGVQD